MQVLSLCCNLADFLTLAAGYSARDMAKDLVVLEAGASARKRGHLIKAEFLKIAKWKSSRPARRYSKNSDKAVESVSARAFALTNDVEKALALTELDGVSIRTATALLHVCFPDNYPLLDVWAMSSFGIRPPVTAKWSDLDWLRIWPAYIQECRTIKAQTAHDLRTIDRALWWFGKNGVKRSAIKR